MIRRLIAYFLYGLGFITIVFFRNYAGHIIPYPSLFWLIGFAMFLAGWRVLNFSPTFNELTNGQKLNRLYEELKINGERIIVDLTKCEIKTNNYTLEQTVGGSREQFWNVVGGDSDKNVTQLKIIQSVLVYTNDNYGNPETFTSALINKDKISLSFLLEAQKHATIYVDRRNRSNYYFDVEFLDSKDS